MSQSIKPCPFCGGTDIRWHASSAGRRFKCMGCHAEGPASPNSRGATVEETNRLRQAEAIAAWNRRAGTPS